MSGDITAKLNDRISRLMANIKGEMPALLEKGALEAAQHIEGEIKDVLFALPSSGSGRLYAEIANSYHAQFIEADGKLVSAGAFSDHVAAKIHDTGGRIHPKQKRNLAIPISKRAKNTMMWPRHWGKTKGENGLHFIINRKTGKKLLVTFKGKGKDRRIEVQYVLKRHVDIKAKNYLRLARINAMPGVEKIFGEKVYTIIQNEKSTGKGPLKQ